VESYLFPVKDGQRYFNPPAWLPFCSAATQQGKSTGGSFKLLRQRLQQGEKTFTLLTKKQTNITKN